MTKIDFFNRKSGQNSQNLRSRAWVCEALSRSSSPKAACTGPSRNLLSGPSKGSKMVKNRSNLGPSRSLQGPSGQREQIGTFWPGAKGSAQEGSNWGQNRVKMAFSLTPDRQNDKIDFFNRKSGQNDQNLASRAWVCEAPNRSSSPKAACTWPSRNLRPGPSKGVQNGQKVKFRVPQGPSKVLPGKGYK